MKPEIREGKIVYHQSVDDEGLGDGYCELSLELLPNGFIKLVSEGFYFDNIDHMMNVLEMCKYLDNSK